MRLALTGGMASASAQHANGSGNPKS